jgi:hypothetical protein
MEGNIPACLPSAARHPSVDAVNFFVSGLCEMDVPLLGIIRPNVIFGANYIRICFTNSKGGGGCELNKGRPGKYVSSHLHLMIAQQIQAKRY